MIKDLRKNIDSEILMVRELNSFFDSYLSAKNKKEQRIYRGLINSMTRKIQLINETIPPIIERIGLSKKLTPSETVSKNAEIAHVKMANIVLVGDGKEKFLKELNISENLLKKLKKKNLKKKTDEFTYKKPSLYGKFANKIFLDFSDRILRKEELKRLTFNVRRSNINILASTYFSMMFLSMFIAGIVGIFALTFIILFDFSLTAPFFTIATGNYFIEAIKFIWIPLLFSAVTFIAFYTYPGAEKSSLGRRIDTELPFMVIHMGSISGSGIEPLALLKIIAMSKDYKYAGQEIKKLLNQTNIYGYNLSTALRNVALSTPSNKFAELLIGIGVTINSGGDIKKFFEKRSESLLLEYRLEREKDTKTAETFMDLYISIVIATPMILLMILMMVSVAGIQTGFSPEQLTVAVIGIVTIINVLFLTFLHLKQPTI